MFYVLMGSKPAINPGSYYETNKSSSFEEARQYAVNWCGDFVNIPLNWNGESLNS